MSKKTVVSLGVILTVLTGAVYVLVSTVSSPKTPEPTQQVTSNPDIIPSVPATQLDTLKAGGSSYADPKGVFVFLYPSEYKLDTQNNGQYTRIYKTGATQKGQTEIYDGVIIVMESVDLQNQLLEQWVDAQIKERTADGTTQITEPKKSIILTSYPGFSYTGRGLGEAKHIIIQKDASSHSAISIDISVNDPQNKGFQNEVDTILSTIQLLK